VCNVMRVDDSQDPGCVPSILQEPVVAMAARTDGFFFFLHVRTNSLRKDLVKDTTREGEKCLQTVRTTASKTHRTNKR
jgi:hypothetical protein